MKIRASGALPGDAWHRLTMPRRSVHAHAGYFFVILSEVIAPRSGGVTQSKDPVLAVSTGGPKRGVSTSRTRHSSLPHNNPVVTQNPSTSSSACPQPRRGTLPRPGVSHKKIPNPIRPNNPAAVQFNRFLLREAMHDQEYSSKGYSQGSNRALRKKLAKNFFIHLKSRSTTEALVYR